MSNTNVGIKTSNKIDWFNQKKYHANRKTNLSDSDFRNEKCINIVEINKNFGSVEKLTNSQVESGELKRSDITRLLAATNSKIGKYEKELDELSKSLEKLVIDGNSDSKEFIKLSNKYNKKKNETLPKAKAKAEFLKEQRDGTVAKKIDNTNKNRNHFFELTFSITKAPNHLRRDLNYAKDLLEVVKEFYNELDLECDLHSFSTHLDQSSPHVHILGSYENSTSSFNKDLEKKFGIKFNYFSLNNSFNKFVRNHPKLQKYQHVKNLEHITRGGKFEYQKNLKAYKDESKKIALEVDKEIKEVKDIKNYGFVVHSREEILEDALREEMIENRLKSKISTKLAKNNENLTNDMGKVNNALNKALNDAKIINLLEIEVQKTKKDLNWYRTQNEKTKILLEDRNNEISELKNKYEHKNDLNRNFNHH